MKKKKSYSSKDVPQMLRDLADSHEDADDGDGPDLDDQQEANVQSEGRNRTTSISNMNPKKKMAIIASLRMKKSKK